MSTPSKSVSSTAFGAVRALGAVSIMLGACATGCATAPKATAPKVTAADYAPLPVGAAWTYDVEYPGQSGEMTIALLETKDGYVVDNKKGALRHTGDGLRDRERYLIRNPLQVGNRWRSVVGPSAVEHAEIESVGQPCQARAGQFPDCLVVHGQIRRDKNMTLHIRWTWARGVGLIKLQTDAEIAGKGLVPQVKQNLTKYRLTGGLKAAPGQPASAPTIQKSPATTDGDDGPDTWSKE